MQVNDLFSYLEDVLCPFPERVLLYGKYLSASPQPPELFSFICHDRHLSAFLSCLLSPDNSNPECTTAFVTILLQQNHFVNKKELTFPGRFYIIKNSSGYTSELFLILIWRCTKRLKDRTRNAAGRQPVRGFKSSISRSFFVKFFIIKMHNKLDNRCFYMYNCNSKRNLQVGFDRDWSNGMIGVPKFWWEFDSHPCC